MRKRHNQSEDQRIPQVAAQEQNRQVSAGSQKCRVLAALNRPWQRTGAPTLFYDNALIGFRLRRFCFQMCVLRVSALNVANSHTGCTSLTFLHCCVFSNWPPRSTGRVRARAPDMFSDPGEDYRKSPGRAARNLTRRLLSSRWKLSLRVPQAFACQRI